MMLDSYSKTSATISLIIISTLIFTKLANFKNPIHMMWMSAHYTFCLMPSIILYFSRIHTSYSAAIYCSFFTSVLLAATHREESKKTSKIYIHVPFKLYGATLLTSTALLYTTNGGSFLYATPLIITLFAAYCKNTSRTSGAAAYGLFVAYVMIYGLFFWSEFGRLILAGSLLAPLLALLNRLGLDAAKLPLLAFTATAGLFGSLLRIEGATPSTIMVAALQDSAISPLVTAQDLLNKSDPNGAIRLTEWWDQVLLFFIAPLPRTWWLEKPYGFGFQYVLDNFSSSYASAGHSIAGTFMGEHIYYLPYPLFIFGTLLSILLISVLYRTIQSSSIFLECGSYIVAIYIPTFYWGGLASFSARFIIGLVPALIALLLFKMYTKLLKSNDTSTP